MLFELHERFGTEALVMARQASRQHSMGLTQGQTSDTSARTDLMLGCGR